MPRHSDVSKLCPGDIVRLSVTRADAYQQIGLDIIVGGGGGGVGDDDMNNNNNNTNNKYYIDRVYSLCQNLPLQVGDQLLEVNEVDVRDYEDLEHVQQILAEAKTVALVVRRCKNNNNNHQNDDDDDDDEEEDANLAGSEKNSNSKNSSSSRSLQNNSSSRSLRGSSNRSLRSTASSNNNNNSRRNMVVTTTTPNSNSNKNSRGRNVITPTTSPRARRQLQIDPLTSDSDDDDDDDDSSEGYDHFDRPEFLRKDSYDGSSVNSNGSFFRAGSTATLSNMEHTHSAKLQHQTVFLMHQSTKKPGTFEAELEDGSRIRVSQQNLKVISEEDEASFQPYVPGGGVGGSGYRNNNNNNNINDSNRSIGSAAVVTNLIEPGDIMKIRGLKQQANMNGTLVEILRPAQEHSGRWECVLCDDHDRVIAVMSENLRHIL